MSSADDQRASDDLVHRLAAKMASADHGTLPDDPADTGAAPRTHVRTGAPAGGGARAAGDGSAVVDLTGAPGDAGAVGDAGDDAEDAIDLGDLVIDLDTYEAAHQLAVEEERSH